MARAVVIVAIPMKFQRQEDFGRCGLPRVFFAGQAERLRAALNAEVYQSASLHTNKRSQWRSCDALDLTVLQYCTRTSCFYKPNFPDSHMPLILHATLVSDLHKFDELSNGSARLLMEISIMSCRQMQWNLFNQTGNCRLIVYSLQPGCPQEITPGSGRAVCPSTLFHQRRAARLGGPCSTIYS